MTIHSKDLKEAREIKWKIIPKQFRECFRGSGQDTVGIQLYF